MRNGSVRFATIGLLLGLAAVAWGVEPIGERIQVLVGEGLKTPAGDSPQTQTADSPQTNTAENLQPQTADRTQTPQKAAPSPSIYVEVTTASWRRHEMAAVPLEPSIRVKLKDAGLTAVHARTEPHELVLRVDYRETRGKAVGIGEWDTTITCAVALEHVQRGPFGQWTIHAAPQQAAKDFPVTYIDTQYEFQSDPYFFFLGELVRRAAEHRPDTVDALVQGLTKILRDRISSLGEPTPANENPHGLAPNEMPYVPMAVQKTIRELGRLRDERAVPVLVGLTQGGEVRFRLEAVQALGVLGAEEARPALETAARQDKDAEVRQAAVDALGKLTAASRNP